uniref:BPTI/Kunitz inhibitor domain-containing protein n=1 Tax=Romanomermis culicivorax TaxID=13658 RepID=A0A915J1H2_ROMCU
MSRRHLKQAALAQTAELCALSIDWGMPCHEPPTIRYAYDRASKSCVAFTFNGCGGNLNSFSSMQECSTVCSGTAYRRRKKRKCDFLE